MHEGTQLTSTKWKGGREQQLLQYIRTRPDIDHIKGRPERVLAVIDDFAKEEYFLINIGHDKGQKVVNLITEKTPQIAVKLGGYIGYSAILFASQMRSSTEEPGRSRLQYWSLEFDAEIAAIAREIVEIAGLSSVVSVIEGTAEESLRKLHAQGKFSHIDFLFLDHVEDLYIQDLKVVQDLGLLRSGAMIVADNVLIPGAPEYRKYVRNHDGLETWAIPGLIVPSDMQDEMDVSRVI
ncbi:putative catechol O-methyltransferase 2 [Pseudocercospora fuligena]|uniref:catechol O-methyltransferase n=1 Tax=Pseudocercospora fuligena TaxID=685502 RepID=A0A8H6VJU6_9PEZI|nr:putative catechol O-methyltransferase 2 [Pseudocercospora fuligena]KAF7189476.1 putative catechol O-methyltransferase 2 [Pseudocercospora fuligena]